MFTGLVEKLRERRDLTEGEATAAMTEIMTGRATPSQIAALLVGLSMKGERPAEIVGLARTMRAAAVGFMHPYDDVFDTCGTGGDGLHTFNVSSISALVLSACGVRVAKHGNRSVSSSCGSADLFEGLGVNVTATPATVEHCLAETGIAFLYAPTFHPAMKHAAPTRRDLGIRTVFNLLGPLTNPAGATRQVIGVPRPDYTDLIADVLAQLGSKRAWVVHGADGLDEISIGGYTKVSEYFEGSVHTFYVHPSDFGVRPGRIDEARVRGLEDGLTMARSVLEGDEGIPRRFVVVNAAAGLFVSGQVSSLPEGVKMATDALDSGAVAAKLTALVAASQETTG